MGGLMKKSSRGNIGENLVLALDTLRTHKFRSFLTVLGVLIGVATIILVASILVGLESEVTTLANQFGTETLYIYKWQPGVRPTPEELHHRKPLTYQDALAIQQQCPDIRTVAVETGDFEGNPPVIKYKAAQMLDGNLFGVTPNGFSILNSSLDEGRFFSSVDNWHRSKVVVIGSDVANRLFGREDAIGKTIVIDGNNYQVIGTLTKRKEFFFDTGDNRMVYTPYETYKQIYPGQRDNFMLATAYSGRLDQAIDEATGVLRRVRDDKPSEPNSFGISTAQSFIQQFNSMIATLAVAMIVIGSIGLLIGGIGVMNIMLVSVTERTREIGVRKAIGARRSDIIWQFLLEAITLTGVGGIIGIVLGYTTSVVLRLAFPTLPSSVPLWSVIAGLVVSVSVGLFFGLWPATKAARLDPIVALRYE
jgi:putative ABC transport system permease protein